MDDPLMTEPESALPSVRARAIAFASVLLCGLLGGAVGVWFMDTQCSDECTVPTGIAMWVGTVILALGAAVVAVLSLRTLAEWKSQGAAAEALRR
ncbi:MAG: hypothetical protein M9952_06715 [Microthrixaceae bacterium]|nr:hypothetical protein [Microthrixaceae bacterium]MCO5312615.1 hypothetical protein [Microthrixaceae bacterium]